MHIFTKIYNQKIQVNNYNICVVVLKWYGIIRSVKNFKYIYIYMRRKQWVRWLIMIPNSNKNGLILEHKVKYYGQNQLM